MAEALALHGAKLVASPIISGLLKEGFSYLGIDVSTNLQDLETTILPQFQLVIEATERSSEHKSKLEQWLRKLKNALYEAEDVIDLYKYQLLEEKVSDLNTHSALKSLKKVALKVNTGLSILSPQKIKLRKSLNKLEMIAGEAKTFRELLGMRIGDGTTTHDLENRQQPNVTTSIPPSKVFGRDKERDEIINEYFLDQSEASEVGKSYSVVSITGIGGAGKSTLAQLVYNDQRVINHFDIKMWICVSRKLDVFRHTREMVESASKNECSRFENLDVLQNKLIDLIKSKKVLLVLDDVWYDKTVNEAEWENLLAPLVNVGKKGSKILVTTRTQNLPVALHPRYSMSLRDLEENVIISLFMHHAFGGANLSDIHLQKELEGIGKQIVQKLHGSPLAVKAVSGQLSRRLEAKFWKATLDRDNLHDTQQALLWSYRHLDAPVQHCFSYFSLFPKGRNFKAEEIVHLWMAEGFINSSKDSRRMEDVGMDYFNELVSGSFLQLGKFNAKFYMHDLFHDLAERTSKEDCLRIEDNRVKEIPPTVLRLYISGEGMKENCISFDKLGNLRTLIIYGELDISVADHLTATVMKCKKLRILKLFYSNIKTLPKSIGDLKHLRYLFVDRTDAIESSVSLGKLYHLQVLTSHHSSLPRSLNNLINLRHVNGRNGALTAVPDIGRLTSLQTLELFDVKKEKGYDIGQLKNMNELHGSLTISSLENIESKEKAVEANLKDKEHLESLRLIWKNNNESDSRRDLDREVLESLQPHPNLINFSVEGYRSPSCPNWLLRRGCLQNLRSVEFKNCTSLEVLPPMRELFPHCQELRIWDLPNIRKIPLFSESLKELWITRCSSLVFMSKEEVEKRSADIFGGKEKIELILPSLLLSLTIWYCDITDAALSRSLEKLTHLKSLELTGIETITIFPSVEILHHMVALTQLHIAYCPHLKSLRGLHVLPSLENLGIDACPCLELEMMMPGEDAGRSILPPSLRVLVIRRCARLKSFVVAAGDLPNLATLHVRDCPSLASLSLSRLTALTYLEIMECPELSSMSSNLPESLEEVNLRRCPSISSLPHLPKSLTRIGIFGCPALQERCRSPDGEDWPKIASIPHRCVW
ncbi:putative disease resistance protein RGA4 [Typha angustifolia]|uniref:putative disease resistance protein RGA4 n=1 Tax=Typha angustifolia TaxID=59011 RepID=UPI003C2B108D